MAARRDLASALLDRALLRLDRWTAALPPSLAARWSALHRRWCQGRERAARAREHFCGPEGSPAFELLAWVLEAYLPGPRRRDVGEVAGEAMLCLYFAARAQDDRVDEGTDRADAFLEHALSARATELLAGVAGRRPSWAAVQASLALDFAEAALDDLTRRTTDAAWDDAAYAAQGRKYNPMTVPLAAVLVGAGRGRRVAALRRAMESLSIGLQLTNDLLGAQHDLTTGQRTPWLSTLRLRPGTDGLEAYLPAVRRALRRGDVSAYVDRIADAFEEGLARCPTPDAPRLRRHLRARREALAQRVIGLQLRALVGVPEVVADIEVTRRCNLRCPACFVFAQEPPHGWLPDLPVDTLLAIVDELGGYRAHLHLTGGEPFLYRGFWEVIARAAEVGVEDVLINTNGAFVDAAAVARLAACGVPVRLMVSIDGPDDVQETARGPGMTRKALDAIRHAWSAGVAAVPATIMTEELVASGIDAWFDRLAGELPGLDALVLWPLTLRPDVTLPPGGGGSPLSSARHPQAARQIAALHRRGVKVTVADHPVINPLLAREGVPREKLWQCNAGRGRFSVQADGTLGPCHPFRLPLGTLGEGGVEGFVARVLAHPTYQRLGRRENEGCVTCDERPVCGSCQAAVVAAGHPVFGHDGFCRTFPEGDEVAPPRALRRLPVVG